MIHFDCSYGDHNQVTFNSKRRIRVNGDCVLPPLQYEVNKLCIQQGNHHLMKEGIAECSGSTVERLERLLHTARMPLSMQQPGWFDQDTIFQEIIVDTTIEVPGVLV